MYSLIMKSKNTDERELKIIMQNILIGNVTILQKKDFNIVLFYYNTTKIFVIFHKQLVGFIQKII